MQKICELQLDRIDSLRNSLAELRAPSDRSNRDGALWSELAAVQSYLFDLSPKNLLQVRLHSHLFTLFNPVIYWHAPPGLKPESYPEVDLYRFFADGVPSHLHLSEPGLSDGIKPLGIEWNKKVINRDVMRFQSYVSNLHTSGILSWVGRQQHPLVVEIGGGFGGLAFALLRILEKRCTYVIVDLPEVLLLSGSYLVANLPEARVEVVTSESDLTTMLTMPDRPDVVLVPNLFTDYLENLPDCDLLISTASLQEMTPWTIRRYCEFAKTKCRGYFFSVNTERHPHNVELTGQGLSDILAEYFELFPGRHIYDNLPDGALPWFHRVYLARSPLKDAPKPEGTIRFVGGNGGTGQRYTVSIP